MKKDTKRGRDSEKIPVSSKTTVLSSTDNIRRTIDVNNSDDSDEEFIDFIIGKYYNKKKGESEPKNYEYVRITKQINNIDDLIELSKLYDEKENKKYNINMVSLIKLVEPLTELKKMVGMEKLKKSILSINLL